MTDATPESMEFHRALREGAHAALRYLDSRTPPRFTGVYRYDGDMLRSQVLFDRFEADKRVGSGVPLEDAYCANVGRNREPLEFVDARQDGRFPYLSRSPVVCYSGVLISTPEGQPYGTLCHYDLKRCELRTSDIPLLKAAALLIYEALEGRRAPAKQVLPPWPGEVARCASFFVRAGRLA